MSQNEVFDRFQQQRQECERLSEALIRSLQELYRLLQESDRPKLAELGQQQRAWLENFRQTELLPFVLEDVRKEIDARLAALSLSEERYSNLLQGRYGRQKEADLTSDHLQDWKCHLGALLDRMQRQQEEQTNGGDN